MLNGLNPAILNIYAFKNFDSKENKLTLVKEDKEITFDLENVEEGKVKTYNFTFDGVKNSWDLQTQSRTKLEGDKGNIQFLYTEVKNSAEKVEYISFTDFEA